MGRYIPAPEGRREKIGLIQRILRGRDASKRVIGAFVAKFIQDFGVGKSKIALGG